MKDINATAATLLGFLQDGPRTGWDLTRSTETTVGYFWNTTRSQIYRELRTLSELGFVEAGPTGARDRTPYTLTPQGDAAFREWIGRAPGLDLVRMPFLLALFFAPYVEPDKLARFVRAARLRHEEQVEAFEQARERLPPASREAPVSLVVGYGIAYERAILSWFDEVEAVLG